MIPLRIHAEKFATYPTLEWDIPQGLTAVIGTNGLSEGVSSNGAGKSTLLRTIEVALFGGLADCLTQGEEACSVELDFEHGVHTYSVRRSYSARGRGKSTLDFLRFIDSDPEDNWETLTEDSQAATQLALNRLIGLSEQTFSASVFAAQGAQHFASPDLAPRERKQLLADALQLGTWDDLLGLVRDDLRGIEVEEAALHIRVADLEGDLGSEDDLHARCEDAERTLNVAAGVLEDAEHAYAINAETLASVKVAAQRHEQLQAQLDLAHERLLTLHRDSIAAEEAFATAAELTAECDLFADKVAPLDALEQDLRSREVAEASLEARRRERDQTHARVAELRRVGGVSRDTAAAYRVKAREVQTSRDALAEAGMGTCRECGQPLRGDALESALAALARDIGVLEEQAVACGDDHAAKMEEAQALEAGLTAEPLVGLDLGPLRAQITEARQAQMALAGGRERLAALEKTIARARSDEFQAAYAEAQAGVEAAKRGAAEVEPILPGRLAELETEAEQAAAAVTVARAATDAARADLVRAEEGLKRLVSLAERHGEALAALARLQGRTDLLKALEAAYGRNGIPALILESSAIPHIEAEAERVLQELGVPYRVELVTQRETKSGTLKDTLDVVVHEPSGPRRYETYSGGEQTRLEFALRIALARLVASRRGAEAGILVLDELQFLDQAGMSQVASVLRGLTEFRSVLLVSHDDTLQGAFDQQILVVRDEAGSRLEEVSA